jgi:hypothetical protein
VQQDNEVRDGWVSSGHKYAAAAQSRVVEDAYKGKQMMPRAGGVYDLVISLCSGAEVAMPPVEAHMPVRAHLRRILLPIWVRSNDRMAYICGAKVTM